MSTFSYEPTFQLGGDTSKPAPATEYRLLTKDFVSTFTVAGKTYLKVEPEGLRLLAAQAFNDISFYLRTAHLAKLSQELEDPEASDNDRFVIYTHLQNAVVAAAGNLPGCQDTGTAIVIGKRGKYVFTDFDEEQALSHGIWQTYQDKNLRYSQIAPQDMFKEKNTGNNLPAQIDLFSTEGSSYEFLFMAKGGGSANKMYLYQSTPAVLTEKGLEEFIRTKLKDIGTSACPPYHLAVVVGGTSAETVMKTLKLATAGYLDTLPTTGSASGRAFRDLDWEKRVLKIAQESKIGAQFGGKYFAHDAKVIRMPRHAASCPIGIGVSCLKPTPASSFPPARQNLPHQ
jgi:fumarate hydratase class I